MKRWMPSLAVCIILSAAVAVAGPHPEKESSYFYVYQDKAASINHFFPSGWMGDFGDLKVDAADKDNPADGATAMKWTYSAKGAQGAQWAGVYWQQPVGNWGDKAGAYDLSGYKRLTFWARGEKGGEILTEVKLGGITGEHGDSDSTAIGPIKLTKDWKQYTLNLAGLNLKKIIGGFAWVTNAESNPDGATFWFDEIRYER